MSSLNRIPERLFTWVDVDNYLESLAFAGEWPLWLIETDAYWDAASFVVSDGATATEVIPWLLTVFGPTSVVPSNGGWDLVLEDLPSAPSNRRLAIAIEPEQRTSARREPRWRESRIVRDLNQPLPAPQSTFAQDVQIAALHSFKGGVGRTLHGIALAEAVSANGRVLLIDGDLEAPGITWMYAAAGKRIDFAYEDYLALLHSSVDGSPDDAVRLAGAYLPNQMMENIIVMPARRRSESVGVARITPADLLTQGRSPYFLTESLAQLATHLGAGTVIIDLRAGISELSASVLLDPRVRRIFATTVSAQSLDGTEILIRELTRRAPSRPIDPPVSVIITQYHASDSDARLAELTAPLLDATSAAWGPPSGQGEEQDPIALDISATPIFSVFQDSLLGLPSSWDDVTSITRHAGLVAVLQELADDISGGSREPGSAAQLQREDDLPTARERLADYANSLAYAETSDSQEFLPTDSLRNLVMSHRTEAPLAVVVGAKGAGKTFTQLQMCYRRDWSAYASAVGVEGVSLDALLIPVLTSQNLSDRANSEIDEIRRSASFDSQASGATRLEIKDAIRAGLAQGLGEREWRGLWLSCIGRAAGIDVDPETAEVQLANLALADAKSRVFLIDGLEDVLQEVSTDRGQQRALRVLLTDTLDWLRSLRGRPFGLVIFVRRDLVRAALLQNSAQFMAKYKEYELAWDSSEAVRLAWWVGQQSGALRGSSAVEIAAASDEELTLRTEALWGEKMGTERSREARSRGWFIAALSDFNGSIQARDIVTFLSSAAKGSLADNRWEDRILAPAAMREALVVCSTQKIREIGEETPQIRDILDRLRSLPTDERQIPFTREETSLSAADLQLLEDNGVVFREDDRYWIPEIFRHGLGFRATGRPRIVAVANLVRKRNNQD